MGAICVVWVCVCGVLSVSSVSTWVFVVNGGALWFRLSALEVCPRCRRAVAVVVFPIRPAFRSCFCVCLGGGLFCICGESVPLYVGGEGKGLA